jgi:hypothetical protein
MKRIFLIILLSVAFVIEVRGDTPLAEYVARLDRAAEALSGLFQSRDEGEENKKSEEKSDQKSDDGSADDGQEMPTDEEIIAALEEARLALPETAEVSFDGRVIKIDNRDLAETLDRLLQHYREEVGNEEDRYDRLVNVASSIFTLAERVATSIDSAPATIEVRRDRLEAILARSEYQIENRQESRLQRWVRETWRGFIRFLLRFFEQKSGRRTPTGALSYVRILIAISVVAAIIAGSLLLARRIRLRRRSREKEETREVLGETLDANATAADLRVSAAEMARRGDFRAAIRRAYIALLYELDERGKLRLDRAKTNRDYLNELRPDPNYFIPVSARTQIFERVWYGQRAATREDFEDFVKP